MTTALGLKGKDFLLVGGDSQITTGQFKEYSTKVFKYRNKNLSIICVYAGRTSLAEMSYKKILVKLKSQTFGMSKVLEIIENTLVEIHKKHVFPVSPNPDMRPDFRFIFGIWTNDGLELVTTENTTVTLIEKYECFGTGGDVLGNFLLDRLYEPAKQTGFGLYQLLIYVLQQCKKYDTYSDGESKTLVLFEDGTVGVGIRGNIALSEQVYDSFDRLSNELMFQLSDFMMPKEELEGRLSKFQHQIRSIWRNKQREKVTKRDLNKMYKFFGDLPK